MPTRGRFGQADGIEAREVGEELFLAVPALGTIHHLNPMASAAWRALKTPCSEMELIALFASAFPAMPNRRIARDIANIMGFFAENKLILPVAGLDD